MSASVDWEIILLPIQVTSTIPNSPQLLVLLSYALGPLSLKIIKFISESQPGNEKFSSFKFSCYPQHRDNFSPP